MRVLGISPLDKDVTVSFLEDGRVVFACAEERLSRVKLQSGFPDRALQLGFARTGWTPANVGAVAYAFFDWHEEARLIREAVELDAERNGPGATAASAAMYRRAVANGYAVDRAVRIPGLDMEESEFVPRKAWWKRLFYERVTASAWADRRAHRRLLRAWEEQAVADHRRWNAELAAGLARHGLGDKPLRRF